MKKNNERSSYEYLDNGTNEKINELVGINLPVSDTLLMQDGYRTVFDTYRTKEELIQSLDECSEEEIQQILEESVYELDGFYILYNEINYDSDRNLPIGDFSETELQEMESYRQIEELEKD